VADDNGGWKLLPQYIFNQVDIIRPDWFFDAKKVSICFILFPTTSKFTTTTALYVPMYVPNG
jgi:hypothetical protein